MITTSGPRAGTLCLVSLLLLAAPAVSAGVADGLTIGSAVVPAGTSTVRLPLFVHDAPGTIIGRDQPAGRKISSIIFRATYADRCATVRFDTSGGLASGLEGTIVVTSGTAVGNVYWVFNMPEQSGLIPFTDAPAPGDRVGDLVFTLLGCSGAPIYVDFDTANTVLGAQSNVEEQEESGDLRLVHGTISFAGGPTPVPSRTPIPPVTRTATVPKTATRTATAVVSSTPRTPAATFTPFATRTDAGPGDTSVTPRPTADGTRVPLPTFTPAPTCVGPCGGGIGGGDLDPQVAGIPAAGTAGLALLGAAIAAIGLALARRL